MPAGAPLPGGEQYQLPTGSFTRNRTRALALWKLAAQGVGPGQMFSCDAALRRGLVPVGVVCWHGEAVPIISVNSEFDKDPWDPSYPEYSELDELWGFPL